MNNRLEEIRKRDEEWDYSSRLDACDDRRWLLGEVDAQREELERLRAIETNVKGIILFLLPHLQKIPPLAIRSNVC